MVEESPFVNMGQSAQPFRNEEPREISMQAGRTGIQGPICLPGAVGLWGGKNY